MHYLLLHCTCSESCPSCRVRSRPRREDWLGLLPDCLFSCTDHTQTLVVATVSLARSNFHQMHGSSAVPPKGRGDLHLRICYATSEQATQDTASLLAHVTRLGHRTSPSHWQALPQRQSIGELPSCDALVQGPVRVLRQYIAASASFRKMDAPFYSSFKTEAFALGC